MAKNQPVFRISHVFQTTAGESQPSPQTCRLPTNRTEKGQGFQTARIAEVHDNIGIVPLTDAVERVRFNIKHHGEHCNNWETNTIQYLVDPLLKALGWDFDNPLEVVREYRPDPSTDHRVDIALVENTEPIALIEVKKLNHECTDRDLDQLEGYVSAMNKVIGILTNGEVWQIYYVFDGEIELPCQMDIIESSVNHVATTLSDFIAKHPLTARGGRENLPAAS